MKPSHRPAPAPASAIRRPGHFFDAFQAILDDFRTSYVLRYTPRGGTPKGWHELTVKVTRRGSYTIRARKGYEGS